MPVTIQIAYDEKMLPVELDFATWRWAAQPIDRVFTLLPESFFPFAVTYEGKRYDLYSDGTFDEEEL